MSMVGGGGGGHLYDNPAHTNPSPPPRPSHHLLEVTIISAQDLYPATHRMTTYATAWVDPEHKLSTRIDMAGRSNPNWNDKLVFRVDDTFLRSDTSGITIHINAVTTIRKDPVVGTVRLVLSALNPSAAATRCAALQVRRPKSLRPQGIINVAVALLDNYIHSMPLDPAFVLKDIVDSPNRTFPRSASSLTAATSFSKGSECDEEWKHGGTNGEYRKLERNDSVEVGRGVVEQEAEELESKLEKWRIDLSPLHDTTKKKKHRRAFTLPVCLCGAASVRD